MFLQDLYTYPIKSLKGTRLENAEVAPRGLKYDRRWMLVDKKGRFMSQRTYAQMALIRVHILEHGLQVEVEGATALFVPFQSSKETLMVDIWDDTCPAQRVSPQADEWFSDLFGEDCSLVYMPDNEQFKRSISPKYALDETSQVSFADGHPYLLIGTASLHDLNGRLDKPIKMNRFRPNLVVKTDVPFVEDTWKSIQIGDIVFEIVKPCARCQVTTIEQETAIMGKEPLKTLSTYRLQDQKIMFGQNLIARQEGHLQVGNQVKVLKFKEPKA